MILDLIRGPSALAVFFLATLLMRARCAFGVEISAFCFSDLVFMVLLVTSVVFVGLKSRVISNTSPFPLLPRLSVQAGLRNGFNIARTTYARLWPRQGKGLRSRSCKMPTHQSQQPSAFQCAACGAQAGL